MSYSTSPITLRRILREYQPLLAGKDCIWHRPPNLDARRWANRWSYKLREGLIVAKANPEEFPDLAAIANKVRVFITSADIVEMKLEHSLSSSTVETQESRPVHLATHVSKTGATLQEVLQLFKAQLERHDGSKMHFPETQLSLDDARKLATEVGLLGWMVLRSRDGALTLAPDDPDVPAEAKVSPLARERFTTQ